MSCAGTTVTAHADSKHQLFLIQPPEQQAGLRERLEIPLPREGALIRQSKMKTSNKEMPPLAP